MLVSTASTSAAPVETRPTGAFPVPSVLAGRAPGLPGVAKATTQCGTSAQVQCSRSSSHSTAAARPGRSRSTSRSCPRWAPEGRVFLIAGGPGQGSARSSASVSRTRRPLPLPLPGVHARRLRRPRHRRVRADRLPGVPGRDHGRRSGATQPPVRGRDRAEPRLLQHGRSRRGSRGRAAGARRRQGGALRRLVRDEARAGLRACVSRPTSSGSCSTPSCRRSCPIRSARTFSASCRRRSTRSAPAAAAARRRRLRRRCRAVANALAAKPLEGKVLARTARR